MKKSKSIIDVRPLPQRETKMNTRKGMSKLRSNGYFDATEYKQSELYDNEKI